MANMPDVNKTQISLQVSNEDDRRLIKLSEEGKVSKASIANAILHEGLASVELDSDDYLKIAELVMKRKAKRGEHNDR